MPPDHSKTKKLQPAAQLSQQLLSADLLTQVFDLPDFMKKLDLNTWDSLSKTSKVVRKMCKAHVKAALLGNNWVIPQGIRSFKDVRKYVVNEILPIWVPRSTSFNDFCAGYCDLPKKVTPMYAQLDSGDYHAAWSGFVYDFDAAITKRDEDGYVANPDLYNTKYKDKLSRETNQNRIRRQIQYDAFAFGYVSDDMKKNFLLAKEAIEKEPHIVALIPSDHPNLHELRLLAVQEDPTAMEFIPEAKRDAYVDHALENDGYALTYVAPDQRTKDRCLLALKTSSEIWYYIPEILRRDTDIIDAFIITCEEKGKPVKTGFLDAFHLIREEEDKHREDVNQIESGKCLSTIPSRFRSENLCCFALHVSVKAWPHVPKYLQSRVAVQEAYKAAKKRHDVEVVAGTKRRSNDEVVADDAKRLREEEIAKASAEFLLDPDSKIGVPSSPGPRG